MLPELPESPADEEGWSPTSYFDTIRELIADRDGWEVIDDEMLLWFFSFTKFLMFRDLSPDAWPEGSELNSNELIRGLLAEGFAHGNALPPICGDDDPIDTTLSPADVIHVTDADSSQAVVVAEIAKGRNLVVQGPPGTGKSQTITNAIAAAVHEGKRVLFVSEKMAALEVVKRRLDTIGLGPMTLELHSHKARKREVLEELKATLDLGVPTGTKDVPTDELRRTSSRLRRHDAVLHAAVANSGMSPFQAIGHLMRLRSAGRSALNYQVPEVTGWTRDEFRQRSQVAKELDQLLGLSGGPSNNPWHGVRCKPMTPADLERLVARLRDTQGKLSQLQDANADLARALGLPVANNILETSQSAQLASYVGRCPACVDRMALAGPTWETEIDELSKALTNAKELRRLRQTVGEQVNDAALELTWSAHRIALAGYGNSWFRFLNASFRNAVATLRGVCIEEPPKDAGARVALVDSIIAIQKATEKLESDNELGRTLLGRIWSGLDTDFEAAESIVAWVKEGAKSSLMKRHGRFLAAKLCDPSVIAEPLGRIAKLLKLVDQQLAEIAKTLNLHAETALQAKESRLANLATWSQKTMQWLDSPEQLSHYLATEARIDKLRELGLGQLAAEVVRGDLAAGDVDEQLKLIRAETVLAQAWQERSELAEFHGETHEKLRQRFAELDQQRIALSQLEVARKHHENLPATLADSGYAKDRDGGFFQNFGPLNRNGGERRLNVLISRAAAACEVFTSIKSDDIDLSATQSEGVAALKMYLNYAEHGRLDATQSHGDADSIFEEQVAKALRNRGLEIDHQIGVGGFFIDLAIRDVERRGRYLLGIECDGAQYHSARWVRDRDRIRQQVLESRGWIIHRIWSTDWFQRPDEQLAKVFDALAVAKKHWVKVDDADAQATTVTQAATTIKGIDEDSFWQRVEGTAGENEKKGPSEIYHEASFEVPGFAGGPADLTPSQLAQLIWQIVQVETPVHVDEAARRCITILGQGRLVASLKKKIAVAAGLLQQPGLADCRNGFLYTKGQTEFPIRNRRDLSNGALRKVEYVAPEELQAAIVTIITEHIGTDESETVSSVAKMLGISNSKSFQTAVQDEIVKLAESNTIEDRSGKLFVG